MSLNAAEIGTGQMGAAEEGVEQFLKQIRDNPVKIRLTLALGCPGQKLYARRAFLLF